MTKILVTDDAELILMLQESFLRRADCEVLTAGTAEETLFRAAAERPDLIILDAGTERATGLDSCHRLKADPELREIPVLLVADPAQQGDCFAAGGDAFVARSDVVDDLQGAIRERIGMGVRASARRSVSVKVDYFAGDREGVGYTKDISEGGLFLKGKEAFAAGDLLQLIFGLPSAQRPMIRASGRVVRAVPAARNSHLIPGAGVRFEGLSDRDRQDIAAFVAEDDEGAP
jgi:CheY-like chemotaxis protein/Tfp pilus assembly protein PilZ